MSDTLLSSLRLLTDETAVLFVALFSAVWIISGAHAWLTISPEGRPRFFAFFVPASVGGILTAVAGDAVSFYACFSLMALASWGLVNHDRTLETRRAGAIYLTLTALSEAALLAALVVLSRATGSTALSGFAEVHGAQAELGTALVLIAVGLKIGTLPVIGALPLTYSAAPAGAAAALAGASAKVGALALLRLLPFGNLPVMWANWVMGLGMATAIIAAVVGLFTTTPRAVLGYSSSSQMGLVLVAAGAGLALPSAAPLAAGAIAALALHHGLAKASLMLGADVAARSRGRVRTAVLAALALPALALVGAPLTSGFVGKYALKDAVHALAGGFPELIYALVPWTAVGTGLLMLRFFHALRRQHDEQQRTLVLPGLLVLFALVAGATWLYPAPWNDHAAESVVSPSALGPALWPGLVAVAIAVASRHVQGLHSYFGAVPPGDALHAGAGLACALNRLALPRGTVADATFTITRLQELLLSAERRWVSWPMAATIFVLVALAAALLTTR